LAIGDLVGLDEPRAAASCRMRGVETVDRGGRDRLAVIVGIMVALPLSAVLWAILILGLRSII